MSVPPQLHVITDEALGGRHSHVELARAALLGGADVVQYREKRDLGPERHAALAGEIRGLAQQLGRSLVVNDRLELAASLTAGLHVGFDDVAPEKARRQLGNGALIGATANNLREALRLKDAPVDYLGVGPVFGTASKDRPAPRLGLDALAEIVAAVGMPVIAIGGIGVEDVEEILATGARGVAVLSAVAYSSDPRRATQEFRVALDRFASRISA